MIIIDANSLLVLVLGLMNPNLINSHRRASIYDIDDFDFLLNSIGDLGNLVIFPNVWTELDNLLNDFHGNMKEQYVNILKIVSQNSTEKYISTNIGVDFYAFYDLGLTDSIILYFATTYPCDYVITSDSKLSDYLIANQVRVVDLVKYKNKKSF